MNSTSLDINVSETLANKTLIVTTILVRSHLPSGPPCCERQGCFCVVAQAAAAHAVLLSVSTNFPVSVAD